MPIEIKMNNRFGLIGTGKSVRWKPEGGIAVKEASSGNFVEKFRLKLLLGQLQAILFAFNELPLDCNLQIMIGGGKVEISGFLEIWHDKDDTKTVVEETARDIENHAQLIARLHPAAGITIVHKSQKKLTYIG